MTASKLAYIFGTANMMDGNVENGKKFLDLLERLHIKILDTARIYGGSEGVLGKLKASDKFIIDTKVPGGTPGTQTKDAVHAAQKESFSQLGVEKVNVYYLHAPDPQTPIEETLKAMNELYKAGKFAELGLSNYTAAQVQQIYDLQKQASSVLPTVYQGNYNPVSRHIEQTLFPVLRKLNIRFYAYSAIAGGFLAKSVEDIQKGGEGRWDPKSALGKMYHTLYNRPALLEGLKIWSRISDDFKIPRAELAYRYIAYHSALKPELGDGIILGATKVEQLEQTIQGLENGPLPTEAVAAIEKVWDVVKKDAPLNNLDAWTGK
ncbi:hypothetical protein HDU85_002199 [Gaertneriomyces sp. JEL0708]|nr:hypothetical protein HDU85_002199 [Gaertneriomyces sp. JEL0708]